jgi:penicillin-binding protein 1A
MSQHLTAGERLLPPERTAGGGGSRQPPPGPPRKLPPGPPPGGGPNGRPAGQPGARAARRWLTRFLFLLLFLTVAGGGMLYALYARFSAGLPSVDTLRHYHPPVMSRVFAANGRLIADLATERRIYVPYDEIPHLVRQAFIAAEDRNFWYHPGIDPLAIVRAGVWDILHVGSGRRPLGASTITQQVVKNILLDQPMTFDLKIQEAILAVRLEQVLTKKQILQIYLNQIYLGQGSYGVAAAAQAYFDKPLDKLTLAEAAFLGGLPKAPTTYNPFTNPKGARDRRNWVLDRLAEDGDVTAAEAAAAKKQPLVPRAAVQQAPLPGAAYFSEAVRQQLIDRFGLKEATEGGLIVRTSLDPRLQRAAESALRDGLMAYDRTHGGWRGPVARIAPDASLGTDWSEKLAAVAKPPGMLSSWRLGVVLSESPAEAKIGWLQPAPNAPPAGPAPPGTPEMGVLHLAGLAWARPVVPGGFGPTPSRMSNVVRPGDVVMVKPEAAPQGTPANAPASAPAGAPTPLALMQIPEAQGALVSLDPRTGRVLALVGGWSFEMSQFNRAIDAKRQPGSGFKPFTYLTALEQGIPPSQKFLDAPVVMAGADGPWRPGDFEPGFMGPITMQVALEQSVNLATLRVAEAVGLRNVAKTAEAFGVVDKFPLYYPAILGALDTTVLRMAGAYASFDELGRKVTPTLIDSVANPEGKVIWSAPDVSCSNCAGGSPSQPPDIVSNQPRIADAASTYQLITMLRGVVERGTGTLAGKGINRPIAGKTGTTDNENDAWFNGFTPNLVTIVWAGFDTPKSLGYNATGGEVSAPIWNAFMKVALKDRPVLDWKMPPGLVMQSFGTVDGTATDAFKTGQTPGTVVAGQGVDPSASPAGPAPTASQAATANGSAGINAGMSGLY